jgi:hypothetical protein
MAATFKNVLMNTISYEAYHWEELNEMKYDPGEAQDYLVCQGFPLYKVQDVLNDIENARGVIVSVDPVVQEILIAFLDKYE